MVEILISMAIMTVATAMISVVTVMIFSQVGRIQASLGVDEEVVKLQTSMRYIVSQHWSAFASITENDNIVTLNAFVPYVSSEELLSTVTSTISCDMDYYSEGDGSGALVLRFTAADGVESSKVLAEHITNCTMEASGDWLYYNASFELRGVKRDVGGAVKYY